MSAPVFEIFRLLPSPSTGRWIAVFNFFYGGDEFEFPFFSNELSLTEAMPDARMERKLVLAAAQLRFLSEAHIGGFVQ